MNNKVVIIGTGFVGMSYAYALVNQGAVEELVLIDVNKDKAVGEAMDLNHGLAFGPRKMVIRAGDYDECKDADLVVITAGVGQKPGESRLKLLSRNASIMKTITSQIMEGGFDGLILLASNPVDILTHVVQKESGLPSNRVFGSGTSLDTARLRYEIGNQIGIDVRNVHAYILGEHGDSEFVCWSNVNIGAKPIKDVIKSMDSIRFEDMAHIASRVRNAASEIIKRKKASYYGVGMALVRITAAIFNNENRILPLSVYNNNEYDCDNLYIGLPAVINRQGIHHIVKLTMNEEENRKLKESSKILRGHLEGIDFY